MKRLHVNLSVNSIPETVRFYNALFNANPTVEKPDYAKWMLDDPRVNFSISLNKSASGVEHLGIQAENENELADIYTNIDNAKGQVRDEGDTVCCYAESNKKWIKDPQGVEWEAFYSYGVSDVNKVASTECCDDNCCTE